MSLLQRRLEKIFRNASFDVLVLVNTKMPDSNFLYITGFTSGLFEQNVLIATRKGAVLLTNSLEYESAILQKQKGLSIINIRDTVMMSKMLHKYLKGKVVGINGTFLPVDYLKALKRDGKAKRIVDAVKALTMARETKEADELVKIKGAVRIVKAAFRGIPKHFKEGMSEQELATAFNYLMMENGADTASFKTIVCFGKNSAEPHHTPDGTKLRKNNFILIDAGAKYKNYCSDMTRTFIFKPDKRSEKYKRMIEIYNIVKGAQKAAFTAAKAGIDGSKLDLIARKRIDSAFNGKYKGTFIHALGHSIGVDVHDPGPYLSFKKYKLKENMVVSNEPGIYVVGFGGVRIEDDMLIKKRKAVYL